MSDTDDNELRWEPLEDALSGWYGLVADTAVPTMPPEDVQKVCKVFGWSLGQLQLPRPWQQLAAALLCYFLGQGPAPTHDTEDLGDFIEESLLHVTVE